MSEQISAVAATAMWYRRAQVAEAKLARVRALADEWEAWANETTGEFDMNTAARDWSHRRAQQLYAVLDNWVEGKE